MDAHRIVRAAPAEVIEAYRTTIYVNYLGISGYALVVADFLQTFPDEVRLMWPAPFGLPKVLFFLLRYYIMVHRVFTVLYGLPIGLSPEQCRSAFLRTGISTWVLVSGAEALLFLRVYAFSGKNRRMMWYLLLQFVGIHSGSFFLLSEFLRSVDYRKFPIPGLVCMPICGDSILLSGSFILLLGSLIVVMLIMVYTALREHRKVSESAILKVFYRDGIFYFICLSALALANIIVNLMVPPGAAGGFKFLLVQTEVDAHVIFSTRMLLHLRGQAEKDRRKQFNPLTDLGTTGTLSGRFGRAPNQTPHIESQYSVR
ncbi:hypothetical protein DFP72DRAFT_914933 [Ephemerocybe angulata]|uniref:DUF6533 domain-containing protein n=1 Tax=Ephemerocybe angulata TaxID=980116 RepID=A0A8H6HNA5_9AGAR|nr:hypothetical protein DFP72DRAFT_914933 [Tulosesus angulatus]